jgi:hypothetical protein
MCLSSYHLNSLGSYRELVAAEIGEAPDASDEHALDCKIPNIHIASSCLQKALRRGERDYALSAARKLLRDDEDRLWRRLTVCAFEDFGLVDVSVTARIVAAASSKGFRLTRGEDRVLSTLIGLLCQIPKDRRLDDLAALGHAASADRGRLQVIDANPLSEVLGPLVHEASRLVASCERQRPRPLFRVFSVDAGVRALRRFAERGLAEDGLFELCEKGLRVSKCLLPLLLPLAIEATEATGGLGDASTRTLPPCPLVGSVPAYAFDGFTRTGRAILAQLAAAEPRLVSLLRALPAKGRLDVLHHLLFFAEGGLCTPLVSDPLSQALNYEAVACGARLAHPAAAEAVALMGDLLPVIHDMRRASLPPNQTFEEKLL